MSETLGQFLDAVCARSPESEAVAFAPGPKVAARMTWRELREESRRAARKLIGLGVTRGTRVALLCSNRIEWLPLAFGALRIGAVLVPLSTLWKRDEIAYALRLSEARLLLMLRGFLKHDYLQSVNEIAPELAGSDPGRLAASAVPALQRVVLLGSESAAGAQAWETVDEAASDLVLNTMEAETSPADLATIFFTSGTTSQAKAVVHRHSALVSSGRRLAPCFGITSEDSWWGHMPLFWSGGFVLGALATLAGGGRIVLHESVTPDSALELLATERCTIMAGWHQAGPLLEHAGFSRDRIHLRKGTYHSLAPRLMGPDNCAIGVYGMSETATCVTAAHWDDPEPIRTATFGRPLAGMELKIIDPETRAPRPAGEPGEILVKGPSLMEGYLNVAPSETFDPEGFFRTGDLGYFDDSGHLHFANRLKDVIKTAGVNVAAVEVEEALTRHPAIKAAHVVGVPHPVRGENIAAFVVTDAELDPEEVRGFCRSSLASYKVPKFVFAITEADVPRTGTGKIEKVALRRLAGERAATGGS